MQKLSSIYYHYNKTNQIDFLKWQSAQFLQSSPISFLSINDDRDSIKPFFFPCPSPSGSRWWSLINSRSVSPSYSPISRIADLQITYSTSNSDDVPLYSTIRLPTTFHPPSLATSDGTKYIASRYEHWQARDSNLL